MRILIYGLNFAPEQTGVGKYTGELAEFLSEKKQDVRVITTPPYYPGWSIWPGYSGWKYQKETWRGVEIFRCPVWLPKKKSGIKRLLYLASFALSSIPVLPRQWLWKPDIVFCVAPTLLSVPSGLLLARLSGARAWLHIQDFEMDLAFNMGLLNWGSNQGKWFEKVEGWLYRKFDRVSTISNRMLERLFEKGAEKLQTRLFINWVDTQLIYPIEGENHLRQNLTFIEDNQVVVLYAGNMGAKQGLELLIEAAGRLAGSKEIVFVLCGDGHVRKNLEVLAKDLPNVHFLPLQPVNRLNELLNLADIHVLPQYSHVADSVMPSKLGGMLASGKAIIAMTEDETEVGQIVGRVGWLVPPGDSASLAEAISLVASQPGERTRKGNFGREYALQYLECEQVLNGFITEIEELKNGPGGG